MEKDENEILSPDAQEQLEAYLRLIQTGVRDARCFLIQGRHFVHLRRTGRMSDLERARRFISDGSQAFLGPIKVIREEEIQYRAQLNHFFKQAARSGLAM